jgi:hypothetical protein
MKKFNPTPCVQSANVIFRFGSSLFGAIRDLLPIFIAMHKNTHCFFHFVNAWLQTSLPDMFFIRPYVGCVISNYL